MNHKSDLWAVIWDMDGVLVDSGEAHFAAWDRLFREEGIPYSQDMFLLPSDSGTTASCAPSWVLMPPRSGCGNWTSARRPTTGN